MRNFDINAPGSDVRSTPERDALRRTVIEERNRKYGLIGWRFIAVEEKKIPGISGDFSLIARGFTDEDAIAKDGEFPDEDCLIWNGDAENVLLINEDYLENEIKCFLEEKRHRSRVIILALLSMIGPASIGIFQQQRDQSRLNQPVQQIKERSSDDVFDEIPSKEDSASILFMPKESE